MNRSFISLSIAALTVGAIAILRVYTLIKRRYVVARKVGGLWRIRH